jgi:hypothetical protein
LLVHVAAVSLVVALCVVVRFDAPETNEVPFQ